MRALACCFLPLIALGAPTDPTATSAASDYAAARAADLDRHDPSAALELYRSHLARYPDSPYAGEVRARAEYLAANIGEEPQALAEFEAVMTAWPSQPGPALLERMARVAHDFPQSPIHSRACFWLANERARADDPEGAIGWLKELLAAHPPAKEAHRAELQLALIEQRRGHFREALQIERSYLSSSDLLAAELAKEQLLLAQSARLHFWLYLSGLGLLATLTLALGLGVWLTRAPLRPVPFEVKLFAPIAGLLALVTVFEDRRVGLAVIAIASGGAVLATLNGAYLRVVHPRGLWRWAYLGAMGGAAISLAYCAVHGVQLTELVITTIEQGADR